MVTMADKTASQKQRFIQAAREAGADMSKEEFARVIGGLAKPKPKPQTLDQETRDEKPDRDE